MKILVVYYSMYGHMYELAKAAGAEVTLKRVPETLSPEVLGKMGALVGKVGSVMSSSATQHGGQESTILSTHITLLHHGMVIAGLPYAFAGQTTLGEITGCSPYGASTIAGAQGERKPSANELDGARFQGKYAAELAGKLARK
ncbi:MAG: NAD(P)H:quinone oxidoreductase [Elusimicrobia bacterium]|nr:NAD(P)H:quinone oxidoreductase [Elusimicrobiota bacterium]